MKRSTELSIDNNRTKKRRYENERAVWTNYMSVKHAKLDHQFATDGKVGEGSSTSKIFEGVCIYVNGYTDPSSEDLKRLMKGHGGNFHNYNSRAITHIIATNLPDSKVRTIRDQKVVRPEWITESLAAGKLLDHKPYLLYGTHNPSQRTLNFNGSAGQTSDRTSSTKSSTKEGCSQRGGVVTLTTSVPVTRRSRIRESSSVETNPPFAAAASTSKGESSTRSLGDSVDRQDGSGSSFPKTGDANFLSEFYSHSRLHYISTAQLELRELVHRLREDSDGHFPGRRKLLERRAAGRTSSVTKGDDDDRQNRPRIIMHVDMDCFFVSVGTRNRPDLQGANLTRAFLHYLKLLSIFDHAHSLNGLPVAVSHSSGSGGEGTKAPSMSEIASCNYECRKFGLKNGMLLGKALKLCPRLVTIPYDFAAYKEVGEQLYNVVATYTLDIEAVSCDELIIDCTNVLKEVGSTPEELAACIREEVKKNTKCCCSIGIGRNFLMAKMATRKAKPDGQFHIQSAEQEQHFLKEEAVRNVPGIGRVMEKQLETCGVVTCGELQTISEKALKELFGPTKGSNLYKLCRGIDDRRIDSNRARQSVSAEINYGIRFEKYEEVLPFLANVAEEIRSRLLKAAAKGKQITLKLKVKQADAPVKTAKFMGHGLVDNLSKSVCLTSYTNDSAVIAERCEALLQQMKLNVKDIRGIGVQITKLDLENQQRNSNAPSIKSFMKPNSSATADRPIKISTVEGARSLVDKRDSTLRPTSTRPANESSKVLAKYSSPHKDNKAQRVVSGTKKPTPKKNASPLKDAPYKFAAINSHFKRDTLAPIIESVPVCPKKDKVCEDSLSGRQLEHDEKEKMTVNDFKVRLREWTSLDDAPLEVDVKLVSDWITSAVLDVRLTEASFILKYFLRLDDELSG